MRTKTQYLNLILLLIATLPSDCATRTTSSALAITYPFSKTPGITSTTRYPAFHSTTVPFWGTDPTVLRSTSPKDPNGVGLDPEIRFGSFFYVSFPDNILTQFFSCLCDPASLKCLVSYKLKENQTSTDFPFLYAVLAAERQRFPLNTSDLYRPHYVCDVLNFVPGQDISCVRQKVTDLTCERSGKCQTYSINSTDYRDCGLVCVELSWLSAFTVPIEYNNFVDEPNPVANGTCSSDNIPDTTIETAHTEGKNSGGGDGGNNTIIIVVIALGSAFVIGVVTIIASWLWCRKIRSRKQEENRTQSSTDSSSKFRPRSQASSSATPEDFHTGSSRVPVDERDEDQYTEIVDVAADVNSLADKDGCDDEGYDVIRDGEDSHGRGHTRHLTTTRPLPLLPNSRGYQLAAAHSNQREGFETDTESSLLSSSPASTYISSSAPSSSLPSYGAATSPQDGLSPTAGRGEKLHINSNPSPSTEPNIDLNFPSNRQSPANRPNPAPHKLPTRSDIIYENLGLVNVRSDHPTLSRHSQVRLVRTPCGDMELISLEEDSPVVSNLYSDLQLISLRNGHLCVVGFLNTAPDDDSHKYFDLLKVHTHSLHHQKVNAEGNVSPQTSKDTGEEMLETHSGPPDSLSDSVYAIYLGELDLDKDYSVITTETGDYLRVLDLDSKVVFPESGDYLKVLDVDDFTRITPRNGGYLTVLDV